MPVLTGSMKFGTILSPLRGPIIYVYVLVLKPTIMVETGVTSPKGKEVGWLVSRALRPRWKLILGRSQEKLPLLLKALRSIDAFYMIANTRMKP